MVGTGKGPETSAPHLHPLYSSLLICEEPQQPADLCHWQVEEVESRTLLPLALLGHWRDGMV